MLSTENTELRVCAGVVETTVLAEGQKSDALATGVIFDCRRCDIYEPFEANGTHAEVDSKIDLKVRKIMKRSGNCTGVGNINPTEDIPAERMPEIVWL